MSHQGIGGIPLGLAFAYEKMENTRNHTLYMSIVYYTHTKKARATCMYSCAAFGRQCKTSARKNQINPTLKQPKYQAPKHPSNHGQYSDTFSLNTQNHPTPQRQHQNYMLTPYPFAYLAVTFTCVDFLNLYSHILTIPLPGMAFKTLADAR
jgi:hypothetical protein